MYFDCRMATKPCQYNKSGLFREFGEFLKDLIKDYNICWVPVYCDIEGNEDRTHLYHWNNNKISHKEKVYKLCTSLCLNLVFELLIVI